MNEALVGLDVGTTVTKAVLFDLSGAEQCVVEHSYPLHTPRPGGAELEPNDIWAAVVHVLTTVVERTAPQFRIGAVALASQGGSLIPSRADGTPTYRAITWMDRRSRGLAAKWQTDGMADRIRKISGWTAEPGLPLLSIAWLRQAEPDVFETTDAFLSVNDFLALRLTGRAATNPSMAGETLLTDTTTGGWSEELCHLVGVRTEQLSPILPSGAPLGTLLPEVSRLTGLAPDTVLINGGQDHSCEALALGLTSRGAGLLACGTAWVINSIAETAAVDSAPASMSLNYHVLPGRWIVSEFLGAFGACLDWWLQQCGGKPGTEARETRWQELDSALEESSAGCAGLLYFPQSGLRRGRDGIAHGGFVGLRLDHSRADMWRAIMEAAAYELRRVLEQLVRAGLALEQAWMVGGATRSSLWPQIVADVTGLSILLSQYTHGPALGAAILAGVGLGIFDSIGEGLDVFRISGGQIVPGAADSAVYDQQFATYRQLCEILVQ